MRFGKTNKNTSNKGISASGKSVIGLDIGQSAIRMVQLSGKQINQIQVEKYAIENLPQNVISGNEILDYELFVSHLQQCYSKLKTNCKQICFGLPFNSVTIEESLLFDPSSDLTLQEFIESQVASVGSLDDMNYDWQIVNQNPQTQEQSVLMVAAKTEAVDKCIDIADEIGSVAHNVDIDLFAVINSFVYADQCQSNEFPIARVALFDIGDSSMKSIILENGQILYKQESQLGLEQLIQLIQRNYQVSEAESLGYLYNSNARPMDFNDLVFANFNMQIAQEVQRSLQFFFATQSTDAQIKTIYLSGSGCIADSGIENAVYAQTSISVQQVAPINYANNKTKIDSAKFNSDANSLTTAFGLALRGLV